MSRAEGNAGLALLAITLGFWIIMRSVNKDSSGRTLIDHVLGRGASQSPLLNTPVGGGGASPSAGSGSLIARLFPSGTKVALKRQDQGRDIQAQANTPVLAPGSGVLVRNGSDPAGFGDSYPIVHFTTGPWAGMDVYFGHIKSLLNPGQSFLAGQPIGQTQGGQGPFVGNATGLPGWVEIGRAPGGSPGPMLQPLLPGLGSATGGFTG